MSGISGEGAESTHGSAGPASATHDELGPGDRCSGPGRGEDSERIPALGLEILRQLLRSTGHPAASLARDIRRLVRAKCVVVIQCCVAEINRGHRVVSVAPRRNRAWAESPAARRLYQIVHDTPEMRVWNAGDSSEAAGILSEGGFALSVIVPLQVGPVRVGAMLVLGLSDGERSAFTGDLLQYVAPDVALLLRKAFQSKLQDEVLRRRTRELETRNDELRATERRVRSLLAESTQAQSALLSILEDRKAAEEALRESEDKFHTLAKVAPVGIFRTDAEGRSIYVNEAMCRITGRTLEESLGFGWLEGLTRTTRRRVHEAWGEAVRKQLPFKTHSRIVRKNGSVVRVVAEADAVVDAKGRILGYVGTITDISDLKEAEEALRESKTELRRLNEELERRVEGPNPGTGGRPPGGPVSMMQDADLQRQNAEDLLQAVVGVDLQPGHAVAGGREQPGGRGDYGYPSEHSVRQSQVRRGDRIQRGGGSLGRIRASSSRANIHRSFTSICGPPSRRARPGWGSSAIGRRAGSSIGKPPRFRRFAPRMERSAVPSHQGGRHRDQANG